MQLIFLGYQTQVLGILSIAQLKDDFANFHPYNLNESTRFHEILPVYVYVWERNFYWNFYADKFISGD